MSNIQVKNVPVLAAEDETAAISHVSYSEATDEVLGFCGVDGADQCLDKFTVVVGNGEQGYNAIVNAFSDCKIGSFASNYSESTTPQPTTVDSANHAHL